MDAPETTQDASPRSIPFGSVGSTRFDRELGLQPVQVLPPLALEAEVLNWLQCLGGQPLTKLLDIAARQQIPAMHVALAVGRLQARGRVGVTSLSQLVTLNLPPRRSVWHRCWDYLRGQPATYLLACVGFTTGFCLAFF